MVLKMVRYRWCAVIGIYPRATKTSSTHFIIISLPLTLFIFMQAFVFVCRYSHLENLSLQGEDEAIIEEMKEYKVEAHSKFLSV